MPKRSIRALDLLEHENLAVEALQPANVKAVNNNSQFLQALDEDVGRLVIVNYFIPGCVSCKQMRPIFHQIANKYPNALFLEVNTDICREIAKTQGITTMPTFVLYQKATPVAQIKGAQPKELEDKIRNKYGGIISEELVDNGDVLIYIDFKLSECLNSLDSISFCDFLKHKTKLVSDCDEQLILSYGFNQYLALDGFKIQAPETSGPKTMRIFINLLSTLDFDNADSIKATQEIKLNTKDLSGTTLVDFYRVKFQKVKTLHIFIKDNMSGGDKTEIESLTIVGAPVLCAKGVAGKTSEVVYLDD